MTDVEVIIVGGGPAGSACAGRLKQNHKDCLILDQSHFPRAKPCAGWITPDVFHLLNTTPADYPHGLTQFSSFRVSLRGCQTRLPVRQYAIRREEFDRWLLQRSGVDFRQHKVERITQAGDRYIVDDQFACRYLIGAGGARCPVYKAFFSQAYPKNNDTLIATLEEEFLFDYHDDHCHLWFMRDGLHGYAWYVPKTGGYVNVGIGAKTAKLTASGDNLQRHWRRLTEYLDQSGLVSGHAYKPRGYSYHLRQKRPLTRVGNALIAGDAVGLATLDMGEGIRPAIMSGLLAAEALLQDRDYSMSSIPRYSFFSLPGF